MYTRVDWEGVNEDKDADIADDFLPVVLTKTAVAQSFTLR